MSTSMRVLLLIGAIVLLIFVQRKLKTSQMQLMDALFWIAFSFLIFVLSIFPYVGIAIAQALGVESAANFIFLSVILLLIVKSFLQEIKLSSLEQKLTNMTQELAIRENRNKKQGDDK